MRHTIEHNRTLLFNHVGKLPQHGLSSQISLSAFGFWSCTVSLSFQEVMLTVREHVYCISVCASPLIACFGERFPQKQTPGFVFSQAGSH